MGDVRGGSVRARNVLQHDLEWMDEERFVGQLNERGQGMLRRMQACLGPSSVTERYSLL